MELQDPNAMAKEENKSLPQHPPTEVRMSEENLDVIDNN